MKITIKATNLDLTPALKRYIYNKIEPIKKLLKDDWAAQGGFGSKYEARVEVARLSAHHRQGNVFKAEVNLVCSNKVLFRAQALNEDIRAAIDEVKDDLSRQVRKFKKRRQALFLRGARKFKRYFKTSPLLRFIYRKKRDRQEGI